MMSGFNPSDLAGVTSLGIVNGTTPVFSNIPETPAAAPMPAQPKSFDLNLG